MAGRATDSRPGGPGVEALQDGGSPIALFARHILSVGSNVAGEPFGPCESTSSPGGGRSSPGEFRDVARP